MINMNEANKTDFSKEKSQGLHGWFARQGGSGKSKGWVDCNTCRKDPETGKKKCKSCGRKSGEERSKYPACRPTPSACGTSGKGEKWGKKINNESKNENTMKDLKTKNLTKISEGNMGESNNYMFFNNLKTIHEAINGLMQMDQSAIDSILSDGHGWALDHMATSADDIDEVYHFLSAMANGQDGYNGNTPDGYSDEHGSVELVNMNEAEYKGKTVTLGKPSHGDVKKFKVYVKNGKGNVVKVNFGDPNMEIKRDDPARKKSFRARHKCDQAHDRTTPKYWSCKMWSSKPVSDIVGENLTKSKKSGIFADMIKTKLTETFNTEDMSQPFIEPSVRPETKPNVKPKEAPVKPRRKDSPFLPTVTPSVQPQPKAIKEGKFDYETYHKTLSATLDEIRRYAESRGYDPIEFSVFDTEPVSYGATNRISVPLSVNGQVKKNKHINAQIYRMDSGTYELNMYIL